jgi:membrane protease subunit HflK
LYSEYQKAPQVTRDRLYINAMQEIYSSVTKVLVESKQGSNMLYLPLDKIMQLNGTPANAVANAAVNAGNTLDGNGSVPSPAMPSSSPDSRGRDSRQRDRDLR